VRLADRTKAAVVNLRIRLGKRTVGGALLLPPKVRILAHDL
jgi:hypothetical protein